MKAKEKSEEPRCANFEENEYHVNKYFPPKNSSSQVRWPDLTQTFHRLWSNRWDLASSHDKMELLMLGRYRGRRPVDTE